MATDDRLLQGKSPSPNASSAKSEDTDANAPPSKWIPNSVSSLKHFHLFQVKSLLKKRPAGLVISICCVLDAVLDAGVLTRLL